MLITVTEDDIARGWQADCEMCPVARALKRTFKKNVIVDIENFNFENSPKIPLPSAVTSFIQAFDRGDVVKPFEFEFEI